MDREEQGFYTKLAEFLERSSIASFRFEWRCHGHDGSRPLTELTLSGILNDIESAVRCAVESANRPAPVTLVAQSFSGGMAMEAGRRSPDVVTKTILMAPVLDYVYEYVEATGRGERGTAGTSKGSRAGLFSEAAVELDRDGYLLSWRKTFGRAIVNEFFAFEVEPPARNCWILHGDVDTGVDIVTSRRYASTYPAVGLVEFPGMEHGFAAPDDDDLVSPETADNYRVVFEEVARIMLDGRPAGSAG